jgi:hypothetical protein
MRVPHFYSTRGSVVALLISLLGALAAIPAQSADSDSIITLTDSDRAAVQSATTVHRHALPVRRSDGARATDPRGMRRSESAASGANSDPPAIQYPADLTNQGGHVLATVDQHAIYLLPNGECPISACWGNPERFLRDLSRSEFVHVADQYVGSSADNRYPVGRRAAFDITPPHDFSTGSEPYTDADMVAFVYAVALRTGQTGYGHLYHVFLPPGTDECFDTTYSVCYSPDNLKTFFFCAYHGSVDFTDIGHVLYTVEPYQNVDGCNEPPNTPNGQLADSTNSILSHETFETITDPDGDAWWNDGGDLDLNGFEIGDECQWFEIIGKSAYFQPSFFTVGDRTYAVQGEYNNARHGCTTSP